MTFTLQDRIHEILTRGTTVNFGPGDIGLLEESKINRLTTELTDAVYDAQRAGDL